MELKVWVEGIQRIVCGVTDSTTCQDVVYALAHATGKTGRFTLIERWRNVDRLLAPHEHPLEILTKWGEYSNDVQFILERSKLEGPRISGQQQVRQKPVDPLRGLVTTATSPSLGLNESPDWRTNSPHVPDRSKDIRKSLTFSGGHHGHVLTEIRRGDNVGIVKGVPQVKQPLEVRDNQDLPNKALDNGSPSQTVNSSNSDGTASPFGYRSTGQGRRDAPPPPYREPPRPSSPPQRCLPPYRDPPPPVHTPRNGPSPSRETAVSPPPSASRSKPKKNLLKDFQQSVEGNGDCHQESVLYNAQYRDLMRLVNYQREKLAAQQAEIAKYDAEISFWEGKTREHQQQMEFLSQEIARYEAAARVSEEQLRQLVNVEEESEIVRQQEKTLKSELTLLRSKLANCETELLQCKNKIRLLLEELQLEQRYVLREYEDRQSLERSLLGEMERLQREVEQARQNAEMSALCAENLKREVSALESAIADKKRQVEHLVTEMKEANLQSLAIAPADEIKHLLEGPHKPGSTRKMIGSPRQLENAVPTSKNPHGVWV
ncbi:ras association domain-containing protein 8 isoform X1 [Schistocerca nitens]|uniref:ras association domain-containing protein 8 isoform X1 n=1 Tax=Schistocerca nitens TaxID=7011 RepID=UPI0021188247|nr:ras association domain-containing protein 8 isoform X1 [Schistocerca nitens]